VAHSATPSDGEPVRGTCRCGQPHDRHGPSIRLGEHGFAGGATAGGAGANDGTERRAVGCWCLTQRLPVGRIHSSQCIHGSQQDNGSDALLLRAYFLCVRPPLYRPAMVPPSADDPELIPCATASLRPSRRHSGDRGYATTAPAMRAASGSGTQFAREWRQSLRPARYRGTAQPSRPNRSAMGRAASTRGAEA
jgi:hypothetical protein